MNHIDHWNSNWLVACVARLNSNPSVTGNAKNHNQPVSFVSFLHMLIKLYRSFQSTISLIVASKMMNSQSAMNCGGVYLQYTQEDMIECLRRWCNCTDSDKKLATFPDVYFCKARRSWCWKWRLYKPERNPRDGYGCRCQTFLRVYRAHTSCMQNKSRSSNSNDFC